MDEERFAWLDPAHLNIFEGIWMNEIKNYKIVLVNKVEITKYPWVWKLQNTPY